MVLDLDEEACVLVVACLIGTPLMNVPVLSIDHELPMFPSEAGDLDLSEGWSLIFFLKSVASIGKLPNLSLQ